MLPWRSQQAPSVASVTDRLREEGVEPYAWSNGPNDRYDVHQHAYTKVLMCAAGSITFVVGADERPLTLRPGEGFVLPPRTRHAADVGPEGVTCLEGQRG